MTTGHSPTRVNGVGPLTRTGSVHAGADPASSCSATDHGSRATTASSFQESASTRRPRPVTARPSDTGHRGGASASHTTATSASSPSRSGSLVSKPPQQFQVTSRTRASEQLPLAVPRPAHPEEGTHSADGNAGPGGLGG